MSIIQLNLHSKEDRLSADPDIKQPTTLEIETDERFAESINLASPLNAVTSSEQLPSFAVPNDTDQEIIIKKNKRVGTISVLQEDSNDSPGDSPTSALDDSPTDSPTSARKPHDISTSSPSPDDNSTSNENSISDPAYHSSQDDESTKLKETILDEADRENFSKTPKERRNFIVSALKLELNQLLDKEKVELVLKLILKHWRILD